MNGFRWSLRLALCLSAVVGSSLSRPHPLFAAEPAPAGVFGRVALANGSGVSGVTMRIGTSATETTVGAKTNDEGRYNIPRLQAGGYLVRPDRAGYKFDPEVRTFTLPTTGKPTSPLAEANFVATRIELSLSGLIRTPQGVPVAGVLVTLTGDKLTPLTAKTDSKGVYEFGKLPYGRYTLTPAKEGFTFDPKQRSVNLPGTVAPNAPNGRADFIAKSTVVAIKARIFGRVTNNLHQGVGGVGIFLNDGAAPSATTGEDGKFAIENLSAGRYVVVAKKVGSTFAPAYRTIEFSAETPTASLSREANFSVKEPVALYVISGRVTDQNGLGVAGAVIVEGEANTPRATTNGEGRYEIRGLAAGRYVLKARKEGAVATPESRVVELPTVAQTTSPNGEANFSMLLPAVKFAIRGRVTSASGAALSGVSLLIGADAKATTNAEGRYVIEGLEAGSYTVSPLKERFSFDPVSKTVTLPNAQGTSPEGEANFVGTEQAATFYLFGTVKTSEGASVSGVTFTLGDDPTGRSTTGAEGFYAITGLPAGTYVLHPHLDGAQFSPASVTVVLPTTQGADVPNAQRNFIVSPKPPL